jgi:hypothetical protein
MATSILRRRNGVIGAAESEEIQHFRLAGLLHDIGHYPFSHATQDAIENFCASRGMEPYAHENLGAQLLNLDEEIKAALQSHEIDPGTIGAIFERTNPTQKLTNLISSDIDADRLDYLPRTAHFSGLPYGKIDRDYIISQLCEDAEGRPCLTHKALRAADTFLIARLMDYRQVAFHKAVAAYEWLLKDVIKALLRLPRYDLKVSKSQIEAMITSGKWADFTDSDVLARINRELHGKRKFGDPNAAAKAQAIICRRTPTMVAEVEQFVALRDDDQGTDGYALAISSIDKQLDTWAHDFTIHRDLWTVWKQRIRLTKVGARISVSSRFRPAKKEDEDKYGQMVRLAEPGGESVLLTDVPQALCHLLANYNLEIIRVYVLIPHDRKRELKAAISSRIREDVPAAGWTGP